MQMKNMSKCPVYILNANAWYSALYTYLMQIIHSALHTMQMKNKYSALYTYLLQMKNMSIVPCIHT